MILKRGLLQILLAALLLAGQSMALTHGLRHWQSNPLTQTQQDESGKQKSQSGLCDFHGAFAEVLGAIGSCALPAVSNAHAHERSGISVSSLHSARFLAPLSRGPPALV